jgi:hypothetical protein
MAKQTAQPSLFRLPSSLLEHQCKSVIWENGGRICLESFAYRNPPSISNTSTQLLTKSIFAPKAEAASDPAGASTAKGWTVSFL